MFVTDPRVQGMASEHGLTRGITELHESYVLARLRWTISETTVINVIPGFIHRR